MGAYPLRPKTLHANPLYNRDFKCDIDCRFGELYAECNMLIESNHDLSSRLVARKQKEQAKKTMSNAIWCDPGNHAFSARDEGRKKFAQVVMVDGEEETEWYDACSAHNVTLVAEPKSLQK